ncbi:hypothetical protein SLS55_010458 [Diplodia seriata]|uniref:Uncharacterized protein n=1 Tax=Diplodia seriata TaxID=420778 RepID=A0ABR3C1Q9_9PEZI
MNRTVYMNFSLLGIIIIFALGGTIIVISYTLEPFISWLQKRHYNLDTYSRLEWCTNETLQLQRLAHEELGAGTWSRADEAIPVTGPDERLALLDLADLKHPRLKRPPVLLDQELAVIGRSGDLAIDSQAEEVGGEAPSVRGLLTNKEGSQGTGSARVSSP